MDSDLPLSATDSKTLGAFYTDSQVADFLVWWAVRHGRDTVLDPSFGGGVFLRSACLRLAQLSGDPAAQVFGVEVDPRVHARIAEKLHDEFGVGRRSLLRSDFFAADPTGLARVDVVVGNPPFIRYQRFSGEIRERALLRASSLGVRLSELASSWAPFVVASIGLLKEHGRLAMVVPFEICQASYARPVLEYLSRSFAEVTLLSFRKKLFPDLSEDTLLLLAEDKGAHSARFRIRDLPHGGSLAELRRSGRFPLPGTRPIPEGTLHTGHARLIEQFIPGKARSLYRELKKSAGVRRLGDLADVGIGYVTGANDFFHLNADSARLWEVPDRYLRAAVRRARSLSGLRFTHEDWRRGLATGDAAFLLHIQSADNLPPTLRKYLDEGEKAGVPKAYKCRMRSPWFRVPHVYHPDAFLSYMSGTFPRLVANDAGAVAPNTLHVVRFHPHTTVHRDSLAALWQTSLTWLSVELEGHSLGGGMLKLEPTEAANVLVGFPGLSTAAVDRLSLELDDLLRRGDAASARLRADDTILTAIGLSASDALLLRNAADSLRRRRYARGAR